jgi:hypothetical protein
MSRMLAASPGWWLVPFNTTTGMSGSRTKPLPQLLPLLAMPDAARCPAASAPTDDPALAASWYGDGKANSQGAPLSLLSSET